MRFDIDATMLACLERLGREVVIAYPSSIMKVYGVDDEDVRDIMLGAKLHGHFSLQLPQLCLFIVFFFVYGSFAFD